MGSGRSTASRYVPTAAADEDERTRAFIALASEYGRYGYRRIAALGSRISATTICCTASPVGSCRMAGTSTASAESSVTPRFR
jgi:hypothetical protein